MCPVTTEYWLLLSEDRIDTEMPWTPKACPFLPRSRKNLPCSHLGDFLRWLPCTGVSHWGYLSHNGRFIVPREKRCSPPPKEIFGQFAGWLIWLFCKLKRSQYTWWDWRREGKNRPREEGIKDAVEELVMGWKSNVSFSQICVKNQQ
jgi:hypothetical protein